MQTKTSHDQKGKTGHYGALPFLMTFNWGNLQSYRPKYYFCHADKEYQQQVAKPKPFSTLILL
jgi:hypothetical protein